MEFQSNLAPICLFTYNRLEETKKTVNALRSNYLAAESDLFIFSDGPRNRQTEHDVKYVREYLRTITGFSSVTVFESPMNQGLANSIISGVTKVINQFGKVIVLEDDLITSPNFLNFMNQALDFYGNEAKIFSISGFTMDLPSLQFYKKDYYAGYRASSWGWGTWKDRWNIIDWQLQGYRSIKWNILGQFKFMRGGSDMPYMLWKQMNGKIDSWAVRWCYDQFKRDLLTIYPSISKVISIGFGDLATHTKKNKRFVTELDRGEKCDFKFDNNIIVNKILAIDFRSKFSIKNRLKEKFSR